MYKYSILQGHQSGICYIAYIMTRTQNQFMQYNAQLYENKNNNKKNVKNKIN